MFKFDTKISVMFYTRDLSYKKEFAITESIGSILLDDIQVLVKYEVVFDEQNCKIEFIQNDIYELDYILTIKVPKKGDGLSFNNIVTNNAVIQDEFNLIGYRENGKTLCLQPGLGHKNEFSRSYRRRNFNNLDGFTKNTILEDLELLTIDDEFLTIKFGEAYHMNELVKHEPLPCDLKQATHLKQGYYEIKIDNSSGEDINFDLKSLKLDEVVELEYQKIHSNTSKVDKFQILEDGEYVLTVYGDSTDVKFTLANIEPMIKPHKTLTRGNRSEIQFMIYEDQELDDIRSIRYNSQIKFYDNYNGKDIKDELKILWASAMNCVFKKHHVVPNKNYSPDMYARDAFWTVLGLDDQELNEEVIQKFADTQDETGCISTILTPNIGCLERKGNEATLEFLWWEYLNRQRGYKKLDNSYIDRAVEYVLREFDPEKTGICQSEFVLGQNDIVDYLGNPTKDLSVNQGMYAVTLKVIKALGYDLDQSIIDKAVNGYCNFYDEQQKRLINNRKVNTIFSYGDLLPEFVSLWLFNEAMLTSEMVGNTISQYRDFDGIGLFIGDYEKTYIGVDNNPFNEGFSYPDGEYYNGGSWMREELCAYMAAVKHGYIDYKQRIDKRLYQEINHFPDEPFSHEHINLNSDVTGSKKSTYVFGWNCFALEIQKMEEL